MSCSLPLYYTGLARLTDAAHLCGVPVLAGGRALRPEHARRLGADGWAADAAGAAQLLNDWLVHGPPDPVIPTPLDPGAVALDAAAHELSVAALDGLMVAYPAMADFPADQLSRTREDLAFIVQYVAAANSSMTPGS